MTNERFCYSCWRWKPVDGFVGAKCATCDPTRMVSNGVGQRASLAAIQRRRSRQKRKAANRE
jgi:hypothetical protein